jgi:predicted O-methyltransferase YrrM
MSVLGDVKLELLLAALHAQSDGQLDAMQAYYAERAKQERPPDGAAAERVKTFLSDKLVALDRDKAEFCYQLIRAKSARRLVEIGTSYGVSTLYLAAGLRDVIAASGGDGVVIGTEYEPDKAKAARAHFAEAGLSHLIDLREGDLRQTLQTLAGPIDFMLVDIWVPMARPALDLVLPHLAPGAVVLCDNTIRYRDAYADYFAAIDDPAKRFRSMNLPFDGGFEFSVYCPG